MANQLSRHHPKNFHGVSIPEIARFTVEIRSAKNAGVPYAYLCYFDGTGVLKWKITPANFERNGRPNTLHLYHRNKKGRPGFHHQGKVAAATEQGLFRLVRYIESHEQYEHQQKNK